MNKLYAKVGNYKQKSIIGRLEAFFLENVGKIATSEQIKEVAKDIDTGKIPENWHQRVSELRTDKGYTILTNRDREYLKVSEYLMQTTDRRSKAAKRVMPTKEVWGKILLKANNTCEWDEDGTKCHLQEGEIDPIGGGTVHLTPDHKKPHSIHPDSDPNDPHAWRALCGRHQVMKKNYWDNTTGKINYEAIIQAAPKNIKRQIYEQLKTVFEKG